MLQFDAQPRMRKEIIYFKILLTPRLLKKKFSLLKTFFKKIVV